MLQHRTKHETRNEGEIPHAYTSFLPPTPLPGLLLSLQGTHIKMKAQEKGVWGPGYPTPIVFTNNSWQKYIIYSMLSCYATFKDIGCGMMAVRTTMLAKHLPDSLRSLRSAVEKAVPHGRTKQVSTSAEEDCGCLFHW